MTNNQETVNHNPSSQGNTSPENKSPENTSPENSNDDNNNNASKSEENNPTDTAETQIVQIKVVDQNGQEIYFKVKVTTPMSRLFQAYCAKSGQSTNSLRFLYDGQRVVPSDTPGALNMENGDIIDVVLQQTGGSGKW